MLGVQTVYVHGLDRSESYAGQSTVISPGSLETTF